jgi:hypothetical protein
MKQTNQNYLNRVLLCTLIFFVGLLSAHQTIDSSIEYIIEFSDQLSDELHILLVFLIPTYLAVVIFGFGIASVYCASKIDRYFDN